MQAFLSGCESSGASARIPPSAHPRASDRPPTMSAVSTTYVTPVSTDHAHTAGEGQASCEGTELAGASLLFVLVLQLLFVIKLQELLPARQAGQYQPPPCLLRTLRMHCPTASPTTRSGDHEVGCWASWNPYLEPIHLVKVPFSRSITSPLPPRSAGR